MGKLKPILVVDRVAMNRWLQDNDPTWNSAEMDVQEALRSQITGNGCLVIIYADTENEHLIRLREAVKKAYPKSVFNKYGDFRYWFWW